MVGIQTNYTRRKLRSLYSEDARSTFYYRVRLNHVYVTLAEAGLVDDFVSRHPLQAQDNHRLLVD